MSTFMCKMCGGTLEILEGSTIAECEYCGAKQTIPRLDDEKREKLYDRANHFRRSNEFDKAADVFEQILAEDTSDAEAYWSLVLCRYGIEYVEDPFSRKRVPTVHRAQFTSIFDDDNYKSALEKADAKQRVIYEKEATAINEIQKGILAISQKEDPFDIFICYKETDDKGKRTHDSVLAQDLYYQLTQEGFKVFFSRITLEDKLGTAYEPYIFAALNSAKVMVVLGTKPEHFSAVWVRNEWSRFLSLIKSGEKKMLIPAYKDMDPYNLPKEFSHLQAQDMSKLGFMQDLIRGIKKIVGRDKKAAPVTERVVVQREGFSQDTAPLLRRAYMFLEDEDFDSADEYAEKVLDINPECAEAYIIKLLVENSFTKESDLAYADEPFSDSQYYKKALRFATPEYRQTIEKYNDAIAERIANEQNEQSYEYALELMIAHRYYEAIQRFTELEGYNDSAEKVTQCETLIEIDRCDEIYRRASDLLTQAKFDAAAELFASIEEHRDAKEKVEACATLKEETRKNTIYIKAQQRVLDPRANDVAIKKSIEEFKSISGFKDADAQVKTLRTRLDKWYVDKAKSRKRKKRFLAIGLPSIIAIIVAVVVVFTVIIPNNRLNKADSLFNEGRYEEAMEIYQELGNSSSEKRIKVIYAIDSLEYGYLEDAIREILSADVPVKITYAMGGGQFNGSYSLNENDSAATLFTAPLSNGDVDKTYQTLEEFSGLATPVKTGHEFIRWQLDSYSYYVGETFDLKLNAVWDESEYTITYQDTREYTGGIDVTFDYNYYGSTPSIVSLTNGQTLSYPSIPTRAGYVFAGWYVDSYCSSLFIFDGILSEDTTLYARWITNEKSNTINVSATRNVYLEGTTIQYYAFVPLVSGEITVYSTGSYDTYGYLYNAHLSNLTTNDDGGYNSNFSYSYSVTAGNLYYIGIRAYSSSTSGAVTLHVTGTQKPASTATVECDSTIGYFYQEGATKTETVTYNTQATLLTPIRTGYEFLGWYYGETRVEDGIWNIASNVTLTARWEVCDYTITLDANGGEVSHTSIGVTFGEVYTLPEDPTRTGYTFNGWFCDGVQYFGGVWDIDSDKTLTAEWTANSYTITFEDIAFAPTEVSVTFNENYSGAPATVVSLSNGEVLEYPTNPTRSGYLFTGWYTDEDCTMPYSFSGEITSDMTLYAGWTSGYYTSNDYYYPWTVSGNSLISTNKSHYSSSTYTITATNTITISFLYKTSSESSCDWLYIKKNGSTLETCSGVCYSYYTYTVTLNAYDYLEFTYSKDVSVNSGSDCAYITDLTIVSNVYYSSTATVVCSDIAGYIYQEGSTATITVDYDEIVTLPDPIRIGLSVAGWYNGDELVESGAWNIPYNVTLTPTWDVSRRVITLDANGGEVSSDTVDVTYNEEYELPTPTRTGYTFNGWFYDGDQYFSGTWTGFYDLTLTAEWIANSYNVTFDNQGGSGESGTTATFGSFLPSYIYNPTRTGYTFLGYYDATEGGTQYYDQDMTSVLEWDIAEDTTLYARWQAITVIATLSDLSAPASSFVVSFDLNGASGTAPEAQTVTTTEGLIYPTIPTRSGYVFAGWYANSSCTGVPYDFAADVTEDVTLYAKWVSISSSATPIIYGNNTINIIGGDTDQYFAFVALTTGTVTINVGKEAWIGVGTSVSEPSNHAYSTFSYSVTKGNLYYIHLESYMCYSTSSYIGSTYLNITGTVTPSTGGKVDGVEYVTEELTYDQHFTLDVPTREGYIFGGWYDGVGGTGTQYTDGTGASIIAWDKVANTTLYAKWQGYPYYVSFDANGGTGTMETQEFEFDLTEALDSNQFTRPGYTFIGWNTQADGSGNDYVDTEGILNLASERDQTITLYAMWQIITVNVTLSDLEGESVSVVDVWDGTIATSFAGGSGYSSDPYIIETGAQLAYLASRVNGGTSYSGYYFKLNSNIDLNNINWTPIGKGIQTDASYATNNTFGGYFDGNGCIIYNLKIVSSTTTFNGFFGCLYNATVQNLGIENASIIATGIAGNRCTVGILAGASGPETSGSVTVSNVYVTGNMVVNGGSSYLDIGSIIGDCYGATITDTYAVVDVVVNSGDGGHVGGLFGYMSGSTARRCVYIGNITGSGADNYGAIHSNSGSSNLYSCYYSSNKSSSSATSVSTSNLTNAGIFSSLDFVSTWEMGEAYPVLRGFEEKISYVRVELTYDQHFTLDVPTREGYTFLGWHDGVGGTGTQYTDETGASIMAWDKVANTTLYAKWQANPYYVSFDANGGTGTMETQEFEFDLTEAIDSNLFTRPGYTFAGWNTEADGSGTTYADATSVQNLTSVSGATVTLYAQWTANSYTITLEDVEEVIDNVAVTFDYNYGGLTPTTVTLTNGQTLSYPTNPTRSGYVFTGWYTDSSCTTRYDFSGTIDSDITLYAGWVSSVYTISSSNWYTSGSTFYSTNKSDGSTGTCTITARTQIRVSFQYRVSSEGSYDKLSILKNDTNLITPISGYTAYVSLSVDLNNGDTLVFKYSKDGSVSNNDDCAYIYGLTYSLNISYTSTATAVCSDVPRYIYQEDSTITTTVDYDEMVTLPTPIREGYTFLGWYDGIGGTGTQYTDETGESVRTWDKEVDTTLYAKWE